MHDPRWDALVQSFKTRNRASRLQMAQDIADVAAIYQDHQPHWPEFQKAHGIAPLDRGRRAESKFHAVCRHLCELGVGEDETGRASVMAAVLDAWEKMQTAAVEIPAWIAGTKGGIRAIYLEAVHQISGSIGQNDNVYTGDALPRTIVEYLPIGPDEFCVDACRGRGAFYNVLPEGRRDWCEVCQGRDFLTYEFGRPVDWVITNPPFSAAYAAIAARAFRIAQNVAFLVKLNVALGTYARHRAWREAGHGLREIVFIPWAQAEFTTEHGREKAAEGFCLALLYWSRGWSAGVQFTYWDDLGGS
jgi:hypothetical protein